MKKTVFLLGCLFLFSMTSCYKKSNLEDELTTNIVDPDYNGGKWWSFQGYYEVIDPDGPDYVQAAFIVDSDKIVSGANCRITINDVTIKDFSLPGNGAMFYNFYGLSSPATFCFKIGVRQTFDDIINEYEECINYPG